MRNVSDKSCIQNQNTHFVFNNPPPLKSCRLTDVNTYGTSGRDKDGNTKWHKPSAYWITQATDTHTHTHTKHTQRIRNTFVFPGQKWFGERDSVSRLYAHHQSCYAVDGSGKSVMVSS